ncbi:ABC transporter ATP-binding protein [Dyadobacter sp. OTU695]|uniref:ABC transporter ATP-binding protein n=1 Tax=Dyadobacter sp. OTU695 TaxID=3043860 RepID=UPI00313ED91F
MNPIVSASEVSFGYVPKTKTVSNIDLSIGQGEIYGFLGPNGAGKTTTIRLLLGLLLPDQGTIEIFGRPLSKDRNSAFSKIGSMIEIPSLYDHLTAFENLEITRRIRNLSKTRISEVLEIVKLSEATNIKVREFSLGMKQRLGLAISLLPAPELLILDEPTNGLDPHGIIETRELFKALNRDHGTTILVSSHILAEVEKVASHIGIIDKGQFVFQGTIEALQNLRFENSSIDVETNNNQVAAKLLSGYYEVLGYSEVGLRISFKDRAQIAHIGHILCKEGLDIYRLATNSNDLEKIFLQMVRH